jgi:periplasmic divalent cation tolerance protein
MVLFVYITCADNDEAKKIAQALVEERLAACANIMAGHESIYHWQGKIETAREVVVILKTREDLFDALKARVLELHSYDCPCIVAMPIEKGHQAFLEWVEEETSYP